MSALEIKEKDLNKLKTKVDTLLNNNHPASDKIEVWTDVSMYVSMETSQISLHPCINCGSLIFSVFVNLLRLTETRCRLSGVGSCKLQSALMFI